MSSAVIIQSREDKQNYQDRNDNQIVLQEELEIIKIQVVIILHLIFLQDKLTLMNYQDWTFRIFHFQSNRENCNTN